MRFSDMMTFVKFHFYYSIKAPGVFALLLVPYFTTFYKDP
jgi:hypothetical protein